MTITIVVLLQLAVACQLAAGEQPSGLDVTYTSVVPWVDTIRIRRAEAAGRRAELMYTTTSSTLICRRTWKLDTNKVKHNSRFVLIYNDSRREFGIFAR